MRRLSTALSCMRPRRTLVALLGVLGAVIVLLTVSAPRSRAQPGGPGAPGQARQVIGQVQSSALSASPIGFVAFNFAVTNTGSANVGGGAGAGKATVSEFTIEKAIDASSGKLIQTVLTGAHLPAVNIVLCSAPDCSPASQYATYKLSDVLITSVKQGVGTVGNLQAEQVGFSFAKLEFSIGGASTCFDIAANAGC